MPGKASNGPSDDEQELINAEFDAMVSGLNLDQSSPRTYLDELEDFEANDKREAAELFIPPRTKRGLHGTVSHMIETIKRWWKRPDSQDGDGAIV